MQPFLKLAKVWPWLPHFRVVAEYESLSRASRKFGITSAALSKAIRTLEKTLEIELFDRVGGKLRLNDRGRSLLHVVRTDMRELDDAIEQLRSRPAPSRLRVAIDAAWAPIVLPADTSVVELLEPSSGPLPLVRGEVDVVFHVEPLAHDGVEAAIIGSFERVVCVAASSASTEPPFIVCMRGDGDSWPPRHPRRVALTVASLGHAVALVSTGDYAAVLPAPVAVRFGLRVLASDVELSPVTLWGTVRETRGATKSAAARWRDLARDHVLR